MITDAQLRMLRRLDQHGAGKELAAAKAGMDPKTARKYRRLGKLPSEVKIMDRDWTLHRRPQARIPAAFYFDDDRDDVKLIAGDTRDNSVNWISVRSPLVSPRLRRITTLRLTTMPIARSSLSRCHRSADLEAEGITRTVHDLLRKRIQEKRRFGLHPVLATIPKHCFRWRNAWTSSSKGFVLLFVTSLPAASRPRCGFRFSPRGLT